MCHVDIACLMPMAFDMYMYMRYQNSMEQVIWLRERERGETN